MALTREVLDQLARLMQPLKTRVANAIARAVVESVNDARKLQLLQISVSDRADIDDAERFQEYGFTSVPLPGAEAVVVFPNGDRAHPLVVGVDDRRYRPKDWEPGEAGVYNFTGAFVKLTKDGDIIARPAPGREVIVDDGGGAEPLVRQSDFLNHGHPTAAAGPPSPPQALPASTSPPPNTPYSTGNCGTSVLKGK